MIKLKHEVTKGKHQKENLFFIILLKTQSSNSTKYVKDHTRELMFVEGWKEFSQGFL